VFDVNTEPKEINKRYTTLWIPAIHKKPIRPLNYIENPNDDVFIKEYGGFRKYSRNTIGVFDVNENICLEKILISDEEEPKVYLNLTLLKSEEKDIKNSFIPKRSIEVQAISYNNESEFFFEENLFLKCIETHSSGLFQYEYECEGKGFLLNKKFNVINVVYHCIKSFYHEHEYHNNSADSIVAPFCSVNRISLTESDNQGLLHYMNLFKEMFEADADLLTEYKNNLDEEYFQLEKKSKKSDITKSEQKKINAKRIQYLNIYYELLEEYNKVIGKNAYYQSFTCLNSMLSEPVTEDNNKSIKEILRTINQQKKQINNLLSKKENKPKQTKESLIDLLAKVGQLVTETANTTEKIKTLIVAAAKTAEEIKTLSVETAKTTKEIKTLTKKAEEAGQKANKFAKQSFWYALVITLILGGADHFYYRKSVSKEDINEIKTYQESVRVQFKIQQDSIIQQKRAIEELENLIMQMSSQNKK
jgi:hypothetical protein